MSQQQFRECMGLLGLETTSFLSDRIFSVVDANIDGFIECNEFLHVMDILVNGSKREKLELSFHLLDIEGKGIISYLDFTRAVRKVMSLWYTMTGNQVRIQDQDLKELFKVLDHDHDNFISSRDYIKVLTDDPNIFQWTDLLSTGFTVQKGSRRKQSGGGHRKVSTESEEERLRIAITPPPVSHATILKTKELKEEVAEAISILEEMKRVEGSNSSVRTFETEERFGLQQHDRAPMQSESAETSRIYQQNSKQFHIDLVQSEMDQNGKFPQSGHDSGRVIWLKSGSKNELTFQMFEEEESQDNYRTEVEERLNYEEIGPQFSTIGRAISDSLQHLLQQANKKARFQRTPRKQGEQQQIHDPEMEGIYSPPTRQLSSYQPSVVSPYFHLKSPPQKGGDTLSLRGDSIPFYQDQEFNALISQQALSKREGILAQNSDRTTSTAQLKQCNDKLLTKLNKISNFTAQLLQEFEENKETPPKIQGEPLLKTEEIFPILGKRARFGSANLDESTLIDLQSSRRNSASSDMASVRSSRPSILLQNIPRTKTPAILKRRPSGVVTFGHDNWNLVLNMMLGIRNSVRSLMHQEIQYLEPADFTSKFSFELVPKRSADNSRLKLYHFFDFAPKVFHKIRSFYRISDDEYLTSIGPQNLVGNLLMGNLFSLEEQCSAGKSGSFFYYSNDGQYMLKTISKAEFHFLRKILSDYFNHLEKNPHTFITRFYGIHKLKFKKGKHKFCRVYFVIMGNVFKTSRQIDLRYDLKGSLLGRQVLTSPSDQHDPAIALKDVDFLNAHQHLEFDESSKKLLVEQLKKDTQFFKKHKILDYSLLVGITNLKRGESTDIKRQGAKFCAKSLSAESLSCQRSLPFYERHDGGLLSRNNRELYFIGIIDILTLYTAKKKAQYFYKLLKYRKKKFSCIPPPKYAERFLEFVESHVIN